MDVTPEQLESAAQDSPALRRAEERAEEEAEIDAEAAEEVAEEERAEADSKEEALEDEPTSSVDDLSARSGGPEDAENVEAVVEEEVVAEHEEATFESEEPDVAGATGAADHPKGDDGVQHWELDNGATLYDVTHLRCRSARYTPATSDNSCSPAKAQMTAFPVAPGGPMPPVEGCNKQDYEVLIVIGMAVDE